MNRLFRYLKSAFFIREKIPLLGDVPVNLLVVLAFVALGFGHPAFWLLGLFCETAFLWAITASARFRKLVDARHLTESKKESGPDLSLLTPPNLDRYRLLERKLSDIQRVYRQHSDPEESDVFADQNLDCLDTLLGVFHQLLVGVQRLTSPTIEDDIAEIEDRIRQIESSLEDPKLSEAARESKRTALEMRRKRITILREKKSHLAEIESDLDQIEAQFNLALDSATMLSAPNPAAKFDLEVARSMIISYGRYDALSEESMVELES